MILPIHPQHPEPRKIARAIQILEKGGVIAYPTDTVYGLGCDLMNKQAIERLYQIKNMDKSHRLAFICPDLSDVAKWAVVENATFRILKRCLPGPYCFILEATREVPKIVHSKQKTVGIRVPDHPVVLSIVRELGRPIISTTAAQADGTPLIDAWEIEEAFPSLDLILDADGCGSLPTTVVDLSQGNIHIVREGAGPIETLGITQ